ncbi:MAG: hypothetical protein KAR45_09420, partial [Desulfobacteraceae bacterium]|nr:hypothetical protein [Desulfobacteraceae bacterium]
MMKRLTLLLIIFVLTFVMFKVLPQLSTAQQLDPNKLKIDKSSVAKPLKSKEKSKKSAMGKSSLKTKLPELVINSLSLDSNCKITGYFQNKGGKITSTQ